MVHCRWILASALLVGLSPVVAHADDIPMIVITPTKRAQALENIPYSASRVDKQQIEQDIPQAIDDILKDVPNVETTGKPRFNVEEPNIRGISDRGVVIKIDGIRRNFRAQHSGRYFIDPWLVDHVEVVRGANSTIEGSGAIGGVLQFFTPEARNSLRGAENPIGGKIQAGAQSDDAEIAGMGEVYGAYVNMDILAAATARDSGSIRTGGGARLEPSGESPKNFLAKIGYDFSENSRSELRVSSYGDEASLPVNPTMAAGVGNDPARRTSTVNDFSFRQTLRPAGGSLKGLVDASAILYHSDYAFKTVRTSDRRIDKTAFSTTGFDINNRNIFDVLSVKNELIYGIETFADRQSGTRNGAPRTLLGEGSDSNIGFYAQDEIKLLEGQMTIVPGLRFDIYSVSPAQPGLRGNTVSQLSPKIGVNYKASENWSMYGSVAQAFRAPTLTELFENGPLYPGNTLLANPDLEPETALSEEMGVRYKAKGLLFPSDRARVIVSIFHSSIDDYIEDVATRTTTQSVNVAKADLMGGEVEARYTIDNTALWLATGYVRGQDETLDVPLVDVPASRTVIGVEQFFPRPALNVGARVTYYAAQTRVPPDQIELFPSNSVVLLDFFGSWTPFDGIWRGLEVRAGVDNVFDTNYTPFLSFLPAPGRNMKFELAWKF